MIAVAVFAAVACCFATQPRCVYAQAVWELTPYQIHVYLAVAPTPELPARVVDELGADLIDRVDATVGAAWNMTVSLPEAALRRTMLVDLSAVSVEEIPPESVEFDKVTLALIEPRPTGFRVTAREFDVQAQTFSAAVEKTAAQAALLSDTLFQAITEAFSPLASIKTSEDGTVELRLRAGRFPARGQSLFAVTPGTIFQPIIRYENRDGTPKRVSPLPWTFLAVEETDGPRLICQTYSGLGSPFAGRRRGKVKQLALAASPPPQPTTLTIHSRTGSKHPLIGYDIYLQKPGEKTTEWLGRTDLSGSISIPPVPHVLQILFVRNGGQPLVKLPLVPGLEDSVEVSVTDDDQRLAAEGVIISAQEELVDLVTRRAVLKARISAAVKSGKSDDADAMLMQLYRLRTRDQFTQQLSLDQQKLFSEDPLITKRIGLMFDKTKKLAVQFLDPNEIKRVSEQVRAAKEAAEESSDPFAGA